MNHSPGLPPAQGLYDPRFEHDACGVGFVADLAGRRSRQVIDRALEILVNLQHRGACGSDANSGDGAGILIQMPDRFLRSLALSLGTMLPAAGEYGSGLVFVPRHAPAADAFRAIVARIVEEEGQTIIGWRAVPIDDTRLGSTAAAARPDVVQLFVGAGPVTAAAIHGDSLAFERKLYVIRRRIEHEVDRHMSAGDRSACYIPSLSSRTLVYKGMLTAAQLPKVFSDLADPGLESALALVHQRFSTNTFPSWPLAHPYRLIAHNGEINTLRGNINWMKAREALLESPLFGADLHKVLPVVREGGSDSATFDNVLELLVLSGRPLPHALLMMVPEPWSGNGAMPSDLRAFYEYHASLMEPWDGPAAIAFTDGNLIGVMLDRNGLRPARYYVTRDGLVVLASEVGVLDLPADTIVQKGRVQPGRLFLVDTREGRIIPDETVKKDLAAAHPYQTWVERHLVDLDDLPLPPVSGPLDGEPLLVRQRAFGYTQEDLEVVLAPMAATGEEPVGSMGNDAALAVLSTRPRLLFDYFTQAFAQVTNPPLDAIREELVTTMASTIGPEGNLLQTTEPSWMQVRLPCPILTGGRVARLRHLDHPLKSVTLSMLFDASSGGAGMERALDGLNRKASDAVAGGVSILILSDRGVDRERAPIPSLLATAAVHHHLVRSGQRARCSLVVESGDAREIHHCALLLGYGAGAVHPYLAFEAIEQMVRNGQLAGLTQAEAVERYVRALVKGILKVMSKMGISTLQSYRAAQIFEAVGLHRTLVEAHFTGTPTRIGGLDFAGVTREVLERHRRAYRGQPRVVADLDIGGEYRWRRGGEHHLFSPETVFTLQHATRTGQYQVFKEYTKLVDDQSRRAATLRGLVALRSARAPVPIDEVEPVDTIVKRFVTGAMSYGSISEEAHRTLAIAMNRLGAKSNTGEGGEDPARNRIEPNGESARSAVKQIASARFGVTSEYLVNAAELQIKMAQGAKPGEGGQLPGSKVYPWIARVRHSTPGVGLISPPPHHDIYSIEDLAQLIYDLRCANPGARVSVKLVAAAGVGTVAAGVAKAHADAVLISGHDGGTGAAPLTSIKHAGVPWELGLAETQQVLRLNGLRGRIRVQVDGQLKTGRDVVIAALLGAEEFGFATAPLVVSGCIMMRVCHLNTCPVGIATQDPVLRRRFSGAPEFVINFFRFIAEEVREYMAALGFRTMDEMIGRVECLEPRLAFDHWKTRSIDLSQILHVPALPSDSPRCNVERPTHQPDTALDKELVEKCAGAIAARRPLRVQRQLCSMHRAVGTALGSEITRQWGSDGLPGDTIRLECTGSAGQSFGAFIPRGLTLTLDGDANDYVGKGLSGGRIIVRPPRTATFAAECNTIVGNVALYGATSGEAYIRGMAGERFAVRNSGAVAVVEGVGDHGCEYMTGGCVVVLGSTGRNFAAGMTGGIAVVFDPARELESRCNPGTVDLERIELSPDERVLRELISAHAEQTGSDVAAALLRDWGSAVAAFVKVMPRDYKRAVAGGQTVELARVAVTAIDPFRSAAAAAEVMHG